MLKPKLSTKQVIQLEENVLGPEHRDTLNACYNLAYQLGQQGKRDQAKALAERAAKGAAKVLDVNDPYTREYAKFLEELESGHAITMPAVEFRKTFVSGNKVVHRRASAGADAQNPIRPRQQRHRTSSL